jgi:type IV pilus assembly protein PilV
MKTTPTPSFHARGFSLIEVMVAIVVICIGLLGIAKMQAMALSTTNMSRQRSLAAIEAASFASAMHSNRQYWGNLPIPLNVSIRGNNVVQSTDAILRAQTIADLATLNDCIGAADGVPKCTNPSPTTNQRLAAFDLSLWWVNSVSKQLPNPAVIVICPQVPAGNPAPISCTVQIQWSEKAIAINAQQAQTEQAQQAAGQQSASETPNFTLYVEP